MIADSFVFQRIPEPRDRRLEDIYARLAIDMDRVDRGGRIALPGVDASDHLTIVELACGGGLNSYLTAKEYPHSKVIGIDANPKSIAIANQRYAKGGKRLEFKVQDAYLLSREFCNSVDLIFMSDSLHHFDEVGSLLEQVRIALKPSGRFTFIDLNRESAYSAVGPDYIMALTLRKVLGEKLFLDVMFEMISKNRQKKREAELDLVTLLSYMAAYTPSEIRQLFAASGLKLEGIDIPEFRYVGLATKL